MTELKLISWNVNGIRALIKKPIYKEKLFLEWLNDESPDILCLQETKAKSEQLSEKFLNPFNYHSFWSSAEQLGYSGVVTYTKRVPIFTSTELGKNHLDNEGRHIITEFPEFLLINAYFPNGKQSQERLDYKMDYYNFFLEFIEKYRKKGKSIIFCGDVNTAHKEIDLTHPKTNETTSGFLPVERQWIDTVIATGYIDTFRYFHPDKPQQYTWWSMRNIGSRDKNVGWRLDYFFISNDLITKIVDSYIMTDVFGSDHCPVCLKIKI